MAKKETVLTHRLRFAIEDVGRETDLLEVFPELAAYEEFSSFEGDQRDGWIRYVIYYTDRGSGLVKQMADISKRQSEALRLSGVNTKSVDCQLVLQGAHKGVNAMITRYFRIQNHLKLERYLSGQEMFRQEMEMLRNNIASGDLSDDKVVTTLVNKNKIFIDSKTVEKHLEDLEKELFAGDEKLKEMMVDIAVVVNQSFVEHTYSE